MEPKTRILLITTFVTPNVKIFPQWQAKSYARAIRLVHREGATFGILLYAPRCAGGLTGSWAREMPLYQRAQVRNLPGYAVLHHGHSVCWSMMQYVESALQRKSPRLPKLPLVSSRSLMQRLWHTTVGKLLCAGLMANQTSWRAFATYRTRPHVC